MRKEVLKWISEKSVLYNRIKNSYPSIFANLKENIESILK